ncbi:MAG: hypothetical protein R3C14_52340 [Caldilineaceae bacterium]
MNAPLSASTRTVLARHATADGEIQLQQRLWPDGAAAFEIIANGVFLMASYNQSSERALASYALQAISAPPTAKLRLLIGGLGMGFTLQQALDDRVAPCADAVDVVEISPHIIAWNRTHFAALNGNAFADPRVTLIQADLYHVLATAAPAAYGAILLDVDNGPSWLAYEHNEQLYTLAALKRWSEMLVPGGVLAVWSAQREPEFQARMATVFSNTEEVAVTAAISHNRQAEFFIYYGIKAGT